MSTHSDPLGTAQDLNRRQFLGSMGIGLGAAAASVLGAPTALAQSILGPHRQPRAKRVIYLFQSGAPSQFETFDYKPKLAELHGQELPESVRQNQRLTTMTSGQSQFPMAQSAFQFSQHGETGTSVSELLPYTSQIVDKICLIRSMHTEAINHDPAITFCQTGSQLAGRPSMGAWVAYGLGSINSDLPTFVVMVSRGTGRQAGQPLYDRLWGSGFLPSEHQGVKLRSGEEPILYLSNPAGCTTRIRRRMLDDLNELNRRHHERTQHDETLSRIRQYELAFRMQSTVPDLADISNEPQSVLDLYGPDVHKPGTYARNCLLARRLIERDVRFVQLYHMGWDQHDNLPDHMSKQCRDTDQATAALVLDLEQRGLLEDTIVVWGGEFGRTVYCQGALKHDNYGRDHHPRCFTVWVAGGGFKPGIQYGRTDDFSYNIVENPVAVHDLNATILHQLGLNHEDLTYEFQGRDFRLTDVHGNVMRDLLV